MLPTSSHHEAWLTMLRGQVSVLWAYRRCFRHAYKAPVFVTTNVVSGVGDATHGCKHVHVLLRLPKILNNTRYWRLSSEVHYKQANKLRASALTESTPRELRRLPLCAHSGFVVAPRQAVVFMSRNVAGGTKMPEASRKT